MERSKEGAVDHNPKQEREHFVAVVLLCFDVTVQFTHYFAETCGELGSTSQF